MVIIFTDENFEEGVLRSSLPVIVDFYADWCKPCKLMAAVVEEISNEFEVKLKAGKVNVEDSRAIAAMWGIKSLPTVLLFKNGEVVDKAIGAVQKTVLVEKINLL
jgi:thioredoxin 1